jgi:small subunit ribosomal protein S6
MRPYETLIVLSNELGEGKKSLVDRLQQIIQQNGGVLDASHDWGNHRLAYTIAKQTDAHYYLLEYQADGPVVAEVERTLRITDGVLRYLSLQQEHTGLPQVRVRDTGAREHVPLYELRGRGEAIKAGPDAAESGEEASPPGEQSGAAVEESLGAAEEPTE